MLVRTYICDKIHAANTFRVTNTFLYKEDSPILQLDLEKAVLLVCSQVVSTNFTAGCCSDYQINLATHAPLAAKCWPQQMRSRLQKLVYGSCNLNVMTVRMNCYTALDAKLVLLTVLRHWLVEQVIVTQLLKSKANGMLSFNLHFDIRYN